MPFNPDSVLGFCAGALLPVNECRHNTQPPMTQWVNIPFAPKRCPFFYGWVIVVVATVGVIASVPGQTIGVGVFADKLMTALALSLTQLSLAYMFGTILSSLLRPYAGSVIDRVGTRVMVVASALGLSASLYLFSWAGHIPKLVTQTAPIIALTAGCFFLIRFFGQGCLTIVSRITIAKWFDHRRGLATGIANILAAYAFNASPTLLDAFVRHMGWEHAYLLLAALVGVGMTVIGWVFYRDNPEQCALVMDGRDDPAWVERIAARVPVLKKQFTRGEALRTSAFWIYTAGIGWHSFFVTAVSFHLTSIGAEVGLSRAQSYATFPVIGLISMATAILAGWISDHIRLRWLLQIAIVTQAIGAMGLFDISTGTGKTLFITGYGISTGLFGLLVAIVWPRYFGRAHLGAISGMVSSILVFSSALGPVLFSTLHDATGSFRGVTIASVVVSCLLFLPTVWVRNPQGRA